MQHRPFGKTALRVSSLGFGCWAIGGTSYGPTNDQESKQALSFAFDQGINFYDTADIYGDGRSENLVGETFRESSKRLKAVIATKVGWDFYQKNGTRKNFSPEHIRFACGESLKRLKTDYIDLYQLHNPKLETLNDDSIFKALDQLKREGKIRFYGVSIHTTEEGEAVIQKAKGSALQVVFNMIDQRAADKLLALAADHGVGVIAREPLACGLLTDKYNSESTFQKTDHRNRWMREKLAQDFEKINLIKQAYQLDRTSLKQAAVEFALSFPQVSTVIPGMKTAAHVKDHLKAVLEPRLTSDEIAAIRETYLNEAIFKTEVYRN